MKNPLKSLSNKVVLTDMKHNIANVEKEHGREVATNTLIQLITFEMGSMHIKHPEWTTEKLADYGDNEMKFLESYGLNKEILLEFAKSITEGEE